MVASLTDAEIALMREDVNNAILSMRCDISRATVSSYNPDGQPVVTLMPLYTDLPCWYWEQSRVRRILEELTGPQVNVTDSFSSIMFPADADLVTTDVITQVRFEGEVLIEDLDIRTLSKRVTEIVCIVESRNPN